MAKWGGEILLKKLIYIFLDGGSLSFCHPWILNWDFLFSDDEDDSDDDNNDKDYKGKDNNNKGTHDEE